MNILKRAIRFQYQCKEKLWKLFVAFNEDKIYLTSTTDILQKYIDFKIDDIEEFAASYTFHFHDKRKILDNTKSKKAMYEEVYVIMKGLKDNGALDD